MDFALIDFEALHLSWMKQFGWSNWFLPRLDVGVPSHEDL
jgi:hypothetical protein